MRNFMASFGEINVFLFSQKRNSNELSTRKPDAGPLVHPLFSVDTLPKNYSEALQLLPCEFYFPDDTGITIKAAFRSSIDLYGEPLSSYDQSRQLRMRERKQNDDFFRYPIGARVSYLVNKGYGDEIELPAAMQEVYILDTKTSFFLDHFKEQMLRNNPRQLPKAVSASIKKQEVVYGDQRSLTMAAQMPSTRPAIVQQTAKRAHSKPHGCVIYAHGMKGKDGPAGFAGQNGEHGTNGLNAQRGFITVISANNGKPGQAGCDGSDGGEGGLGTAGTHASDVVVDVDGIPEELIISGRISLTTNLGGLLNEHVLFINCRGGDGGAGGCGGQGGRGGNGGKGGKGCDGSDASADGGNGGHGGNGGKGADGGNGGNGGGGGDGGYAGNGGTCIVKAHDPCLLMLVEIDCSCGTPGKGGNEAQGGDGGNGGLGGVGGRGGTGKSSSVGSGTSGTIGLAAGDTTSHSSSRGRDGYPGRHGADGRAGRNGVNGPPGIDGRMAKHGNIQWIHYSAQDNRIISASDQRYDAEVVAFTVTSSNHDGIFEPNKQIIISDLQILNSGGMPIPEGATVFFPSIQGINFLPTKYYLPGGLEPTRKFTVPEIFKGRLVDQPPPNAPGPFKSSVNVVSRIEMLGRPFEKSFHTRKLDVQYPVKLAYSRSFESLGKGEVSCINIGIQNISALPYGNCLKSGGTVIVQLHFDRRIAVIASGQTQMQNIPFEVYHKPEIPDSTFIKVLEIPPRSTVNLQVVIQMDAQAELFDRCMWQADLILRGKLIEYSQICIRVAPIYAPIEPPADILFITSQNVTRKQYTLWQLLFDSLRVSVDFWDVDKYNGLSVDSTTEAQHLKTWKGPRYKGKLMLYPYCDLKNLNSLDLVKHFHDSTTSLKEMHSSAVAFMTQSNNQNKTILKYLATAAKAIPDIAYGGKHMTKPDLQKKTDIYMKCEKQSIKTLEKETPSQLPVVTSRQINVQSAGTFKYSYGSVNIRRIPLLHSSKFLVVTSPGNTAVNMGADDSNLSIQTTMIPLASIFGQLFITVLFGLNVDAKLRLLKTEKSLRFLLPNGCEMSVQELAMVTIAWEVADEIYNFSGIFERMQSVAEDIRKNTPLYVANGTIVLRGLMLVKNEVKKRKEKLKKLANSKTSQACSEVNQLCSEIENQLTRSGVSKKSLCPLVAVDVLADTSNFFRPHQLVQKDKQWDLTID